MTTNLRHLLATAALVSLTLTNAVQLPASAMLATPPEATMLGSVKNVALKGPHTTIALPLPRQKLRGALNDLNTAQSVQLILRNISADSPPGTLFAVSIAKATDPAKREQVGTISWYGAFMHHGRAGGPAHLTLTYDVTAALQALGGRTLADSGLTVVIDATTGRVSSGASAAGDRDESASAAQDFRPQANVRIESVELYAAHVT